MRENLQNLDLDRNLVSTTISAQPAPGQDRLMGAPCSEQVGQLARRGARWTVLLLVTRHTIALASTAVLARLLAPSDFGLVAMAAVLTALLQAVSDMGLSWATVQRRDLSRGQVDNLFWINAAAGILLCIACVIIAPLVAGFFGRPELTRLCMAMGMGFALAGLAVQPAALMKRHMRFKPLTLLELAASTLGTILAVGLAQAGWGYWALVAQSLATQGVRLILVFSLAGYRPGRPRLDVPIWGLLSFGGYLTANGLLIYVSRNFDNILVGKVWGAAELGYYSRAYFLMTLPSLMALGPLSQVMVPALSSLQGDRARLGRAYRKAIGLAAFVGFPIAAGLAVAAPEAIRLVYGPDWLPVAPILVALSITGLFQPIYNTIGWLFISAGRGRLYLSWNVAVASILAVGFLVGVRWGGVGVAVAYALLMTFVITGPSLWIAHRAAGLELSPTLKSLLPAFGATLVMTCVVYATGLALEAADVGWASRLTVKIAVGVATYGALGLWWIRPYPLQEALPYLNRQFPASWQRIFARIQAAG